jgi:hypothetical protein
MGAPAHVAFVEGSVTLERDGRPDTAPLNMPLLSGDRIRTAAGRAEIEFGDNASLFIDAQTTIDFQSDDLLRLLDGRIRLSIPRTAQDVSYRIDSPAGSARLVQPGDYKLEILRGERETQLELAVLRGAGEVFTDQGTTPVRAGQRAYASAGLAPSYAYAYNSANVDEFDRWTEGRHDVRVGASAQYLPPDMQSYAPVLDEYGDWQYAPTYGYVWYPRVATSWRPYYYGRWMSYPRYGWTWVGVDRFGWPTHHYGRWGFSAGAWFWIPGSRWSPAYVSWAYAPGYVSWCPLGFDNRALFSINVNVGHAHYSPWNYWTVVAAPHFGYGYVHQRVIAVDRVFAPESRPVFVARSAAPAYREVAVARNSVPIRWAGSRHVQPDGARGVVNGRDTYFTRESVQRDHAVERGAGAPLPAPSRTNGNAAQGTHTFGGTRAPVNGPVRRDASPGVTAPRAVPRGSASESAVRPPLERAPTTAAPRERIGQPSYRATPAPVTRPAPSSGGMPTAEPRRVEPYRYSPPPRYSAPSREPAARERASAPSAPQRAPESRYQPRAVEPRQSAPAPRAYERPGAPLPRTYERPSAPPPPAYERPSAPAPRASERPAAPAPRAYERPSAPAPRAAEPRAEPRREAPPQRSAPAREQAQPRSRPGGR